MASSETLSKLICQLVQKTTTTNAKTYHTVTATLHLFSKLRDQAENSFKAVFHLRVFYTYVHARKSLSPF